MELLQVQLLSNRPGKERGFVSQTDNVSLLPPQECLQNRDLVITEDAILVEEKEYCYECRNSKLPRTHDVFSDLEL